MGPERTYLADLKEQSLAIITLTGNEGSSACLDGSKSRIFHRGGGHEWNRRVKSGGEGPAPKQRRVGIWGACINFLSSWENPAILSFGCCIVSCL